MGDAIHVNVAALKQAGTDMVAGYVTGTAEIQWTAADWALFAGTATVTIDQGANGSPVPTADVRDVETGAWTVEAAVSAPWDAARPTIYCSLATLPQLAGWAGDVWVADWTGTPPTSPPAVPAGMTCVAVQYSDQGGGGAYDLSVVFDPAWPTAPPEREEEEEEEGDVQAGAYSDGRMIVAATGTDGNVYVSEQLSAGSSWTRTGNPAGGPVPVNPVTVALEIVADVPSVFIQSTDPPGSGNGNVYTCWKQSDGTWAAWVQIL
jgi:hypothetical protein